MANCWIHSEVSTWHVAHGFWDGRHVSWPARWGRDLPRDGAFLFEKHPVFGVRPWAPICSNMLQLLCVPVKLKRAFPGLDTASLGRSMKQATKYHQTLLLDSRDMFFLCQVKVRGFHTFIYSMCFYVSAHVRVPVSLCVNKWAGT